MRAILFATLLFQLTSSWALDIPPAPKDYVYDQTGTILPETRQRLFDLLRTEDQSTGNQVLVAVFPSLEGEDLVDFTNRLFKAWNPGQKEKDNGVVIAFFLQERKIRFEVGYGLEPTLTDALSRRIIETEIVPDFRNGNPGQGIYNGASRTIQVIHGENVPQPRRGRKTLPPALAILIIIAAFVVVVFGRMAGGTTYSSSGYSRRRNGWGGGFTSGGGGGFSGGGGFGGGGGFSGGGGSSGGGGASGSW